MIPKRLNEQKYPTRDETWPFKNIEQVYNIIKQNYSKEYKNYIKKAKKEPLGKGDKEILTYCVHLIKSENKKVIFYTNDIGIIKFRSKICDFINNFKIISNSTYETYLSFNN